MAIKDLLGSEKGFVALLLIIGATVLAGLDKVTFDAWRDYTVWIFAIYAGTKTATSAVAMITGQTAPADLKPAEKTTAKMPMIEPPPEAKPPEG